MDKIAGTFGLYVSEGDSFSVEADGVVFTARLERDTDTNPHDYDGEGWCFDAAYPANQEILAAWDRDEWHYFGVIVDAQRGVWTRASVTSLWGVEGNLGDDNQHMDEVAHDLIRQAIEELKHEDQPPILEVQS